MTLGNFFVRSVVDLGDREVASGSDMVVWKFLEVATLAEFALTKLSILVATLDTTKGSVLVSAHFVKSDLGSDGAQAREFSRLWGTSSSILS